MKLNIDGALFVDRNKMEIGLIMLDAQGETRLEASLSKERISSPKEVELAAILRGLQVCIGMGVNKLILESDCCS